MKRGQKVLFQKEVTGADIKPNATFLRDMGKLPSGESVVEILTAGENWLVRDSEVFTEEQILVGWRSEIVKLKPLHKTKKSLAEALKISTRVLNRRIQLSEGVPLV